MALKILVLGMSSTKAGTEIFILNYFNNINKHDIQFDFIKRSKSKIIFEDEILESGSKIFYIPKKSEDFFGYKKSMKNLFSSFSQNYDAIWCHEMSVTNIDFLKYAKKYGINIRIIHSHSSQYYGSKWKYFLHLININKLPHLATHYFACSNLAADYLFKDSIRKNAKIVPNAIEVEKFLFSEIDRNQLREKLGWAECKIIGNVGRLSPQKNQLFLLDVFAAAYKKNHRLRLIILGSDCGLKTQIEDKIHELDLEDVVLLPGGQTNIKPWLSAMDLFVLPSLYEGLPLSALEAQSNGLPVLVSDAITKEVNITENVEYLSLNDTIENWALKIINMVNQSRIDSRIIHSKFNEKGFNIKNQAKNLKYFLEVEH